MFDPSHLPDWVPFACLVTGKFPMRKPFLTRIFEASFTGLVGGAIGTGFTFYMTVKGMEKDMLIERARLDALHVRVDAEIARERLERATSVERVMNKLDRIDDYLRTKGVTK
jgi:hypothetical protein